MSEILQRISLACAIASTIVLLWASMVPSAGQIFVGQSHWSSHVLSFIILGFSWRCGLPRISALIVASSVEPKLTRPFKGVILLRDVYSWRDGLENWTFFRKNLLCN